ncbi:MerR family transcriptional regulator [Chloroflexota bacterium]
MKLLQDILQETGLSYYTLVKYSSLGLIPKSQRIWRGRKGSQSVYSDDIIEAIRQIKSDREAGLSLREISYHRRIERAVGVFSGIARNCPYYDFTGARITNIDEKPDNTVVVTVELVGTNRR